jgi:hypothetical protein
MSKVHQSGKIKLFFKTAQEAEDWLEKAIEKGVRFVEKIISTKIEGSVIEIIFTTSRSLLTVLGSVIDSMPFSHTLRQECSVSSA